LRKISKDGEKHQSPGDQLDKKVNRWRRVEEEDHYAATTSAESIATGATTPVAM